ncbi:sulfotransferase family protein [Coralloluteibacterium stylophorae]|uniref:Sulfotransferase n=1 Tax=Coralloluteibacterium stylophorae TaxID=1776034 RepID=A0A8J7VW87_9GAMM|nr:sulfotransferase [Coralloluteibacterium stylophorae]MBS7458514.1 sulfotransferase [Coralloluteibacterium stylophorae]
MTDAAAAECGSEGTGADPVFDRPVFVLSPPRSGSTLVFELLAQAPGVYTIGGESHRMIEQVPGLGPRDKAFASNVLEATDARPQGVRALRSHFHAALRDREGRAAAQGARVRMLEKTPKNALRVPFLKEVFPEGRFVFLHRDARETIGSMIDAWQSGRFRTYIGLPGWPHPAWSLVLVPGWRALADKPLHEVVAAQWSITMNRLLDSLEMLPRDAWCALDYAQLLREPQTQIQRLCRALDLEWDRELGSSLPLSRYTLSRPAPDKWRKHAHLIEPLLPSLEATMERAGRVLEAGRLNA